MLNESFFALADRPVEIGRGIGFSRPAIGSGVGDVGSWSISLWVYLLEDFTGQMRLLLLRGLDVDQSRQVRTQASCYSFGGFWLMTHCV